MVKTVTTETNATVTTKKQVLISDETMKRAAASKELSLTFKQKLELAKLLESLDVSVIEIEGIENPKADSLRIKSIASIVKKGVLAVPVKLDGSNVEETWNALSEAKHPRLQVQAATSPSRMEYVHKIKAPNMVKTVAETVRACAAHTKDVEFIADDATRTDSAYLTEIVTAAIEAGATTITVCDDAGTMIGDEFASFIRELCNNVPQLGDDSISLGVACSDDMHVAESSAMVAIVEGADEVKATAYPMNVVNLSEISNILNRRGDFFGMTSAVRTTSLKRTVAQIERICEQGVTTGTATSANLFDEAMEGMVIGQHDDQEAVAECVAKLGYDLSPEDMATVFESVQRIVGRKGSISGRELDTIVATDAMQVPATYKLLKYNVCTSNMTKASAYLEMEAKGEIVEKIVVGEGPIDAAFDAVEEIVGRKFELDDWRMQSVTEGQEAVGECVIKILSDGKVFSGRGISTDIVSASVRAYINAINKVVYGEEN